MPKHAAPNNDTFTDGDFTFHVPGQSGLTRAQQAILAAAVEAGIVDSRAVQEGCRIAHDAAESAREITIAGKKFHLNANGRTRFGKSSNDDPFLTLCLIEDSTDLRYKFRWEGDAIPSRLVKTAVDHDLGKPVPAKDFSLPFSAATVEVKEYTPRENAARKSNRELRGETAKPRNYGRCRAEDILKRNEV